MSVQSNHFLVYQTNTSIQMRQRYLSFSPRTSTIHIHLGSLTDYSQPILHHCMCHDRHHCHVMRPRDCRESDLGAFPTSRNSAGLLVSGGRPLGYSLTHSFSNDSPRGKDDLVVSVGAQFSIGQFVLQCT